MLNAIEVSVSNDGEVIGTCTVDRHGKPGYDTSSNERMEAVIPARWPKSLIYDWSWPGMIAVRMSSIWDGYLQGHSKTIEILLL